MLSPAAKTPTTLKVGLQGGLNSLDPYTLNESVTLGLLANVAGGISLTLMVFAQLGLRRWLDRARLARSAVGASSARIRCASRT